MAECLEDLAAIAAASEYDAVVDVPIEGVKLGLRWRPAIAEAESQAGQDCGAITVMDFLPDSVADVVAKDPQLVAAIETLHAYFLNGQSPASLPIVLTGTDFQTRVWRAIQQIPTGAVATYAEIAKHLGSAPRAVGGACRRNPVPIIVPCHRVVASNGVGGFAGAVMGKHIGIKQWLLEHECKVSSH